MIGWMDVGMSGKMTLKVYSQILACSLVFLTERGCREEVSVLVYRYNSYRRAHGFLSSHLERKKLWTFREIKTPSRPCGTLNAFQLINMGNFSKQPEETLYIYYGTVKMGSNHLCYIECLKARGISWILLPQPKTMLHAAQSRNKPHSIACSRRTLLALGQWLDFSLQTKLCSKRLQDDHPLIRLVAACRCQEIWFLPFLPCPSYDFISCSSSQMYVQNRTQCCVITTNRFPAFIKRKLELAYRQLMTL